MYSCPSTSTAPAESRIVTLAKRAKPSSLNMPSKAVRVPPPDEAPIHSAMTAKSAAVSQTSIPAILSLPV